MEVAGSTGMVQVDARNDIGIFEDEAVSVAAPDPASAVVLDLVTGVVVSGSIPDAVVALAHLDSGQSPA